ncbi:MAG: hypothetical protein H6581_05475 [Bacteroidia bacterium]|nr:hypothetical protein [Bacteroidia bacterium]
MKNQPEIYFLQKLVLKLFNHHQESSLSYDRIKLLCQNLWQQNRLGGERKSAVHQIFFPLVRKGLIEFVGNGRYQLGPCVAIQSFGSISIINPPILPVLSMGQKFELNGIYRFKNPSKELTNELKEIGIPIQRPSIAKTLRCTPSILKVVRTFPQALIPDTSGFQLLSTRNTWEPNVRITPPSLVKASDEGNSKRYLGDQDHTWYEIPNPAQNPDGIYIAILAKKILTGESLGISYSKSKHELKIDKIHVPILIERILHIQSIQDPQGVVEHKSGITFKHIDYPIFYELNRIFHQKITIHE